MAHPRTTEQPGDNRWRKLTDGALIEAMRRQEFGAFREFFDRSAPWLRALAMAFHLSSGDRDEAVTEFLDDAALSLAGPGSCVTPVSLPRYLTVGFRRHLRDRWRSANRRARYEQDSADGAAEHAPAHDGAFDDAARDQSTIGDGEGGGDSTPDPSVIRARLAHALMANASAGDRELATLLAERAPARAIAEWSGCSHDAVRTRARRLRARFRKTAIDHINRLKPEEARALIELFGASLISGANRRSETNSIDALDEEGTV